MTVQDRKIREFNRRGQEILDAALKLFKSDDWESVTIDQIAQQAEVGKGTIYKHFSSKDEIYCRLAIKFQKRILGRLNKIDTQATVTERFSQQLRAAWEIHLSSKELHRVFVYCSRPEFRARIPANLLADLVEIETLVGGPSYELISEGIAEGVFPSGKPMELLLFGAQSAFWGAVQLIWGGHLGDIDRAVYLEEITTFILIGMIYNACDVKNVPSTTQKKRA